MCIFYSDFHKKEMNVSIINSILLLFSGMMCFASEYVNEWCAKNWKLFYISYIIYYFTLVILYVITIIIYVITFVITLHKLYYMLLLYI